MTPDDQNNPQPDYGFIMNAPAPAEKKPKLSKKMMLLVGLGLLTIAIALAGSLVDNKKTPTSVSTGSSEYIDAVKKYVTAVQQKDTESIKAAYLNPDERDITYIQKNVIEPLERYDLAACDYKQPKPANGGENTVLMTCSPRNKPNKVSFSYRLIKSNDTVKLIGTTIAGVK